LGITTRIGVGVEIIGIILQADNIIIGITPFTIIIITGAVGTIMVETIMAVVAESIMVAGMAMAVGMAAEATATNYFTSSKFAMKWCGKLGFV
jgi:hypothetical protein